MTATEVSAVVQAAAAVAACVTVALWRVTTRYANATDKMLDAMKQERADRLSVARAPAINALRAVDDILGRVDRMIVQLADADVTEATRRNDVYMILDMVGGCVNKVSMSSQLISFVPLHEGLRDLSSEVQRLWQVIPRQHAQGERPPTIEEIRDQLRTVPQQFEAIRAAALIVQAQIEAYHG